MLSNFKERNSVVLFVEVLNKERNKLHETFKYVSNKKSQAMLGVKCGQLGPPKKDPSL